MKISIITTVDHNVGDDFVREGIKYLLREHFTGEKLEFENIHKHSPITSRYGFEWFRNLRLSSKADRILPKKWTQDRIHNADIVVQSGAPVYWCHEEPKTHCHQNEWYQPLIHERFLHNKGARLFNLAAGTCQTYHSDGQEFCDSCNTYINEFYKLSDVTTVRDRLAKTVLAKIGIDTPVIPCASIYAIDEHKLKNEGDDYVVLNYMHGGAHFSFGQKIDFAKWEREFSRFYFQLKDLESVVVVCHNRKERDSILSIDPKAEIFYARNDYLAYMKFYSRAKFGIMNRVHGAFLMASYGKPSIVIGNDSRAKMVNEIGLKHFYVNDVDADVLFDEYDALMRTASSYAEVIKSIKDKSFSDYMGALSAL